MAERKRMTTAPLTQQDIDAALHEIPEEEFLEQFDEIFAPGLDLPETLEQLITLDDYMEHELREMFQSIITQYIRPVEYAINQIREGDQSKRIVEEGLEALAPILSASESLEYNDITTALREIERPLKDLSQNARRRLTKKDVGGLAKAWSDLETIIAPGGAREVAAAPTAVSLGALPRYLDGVTSADVKRLRGAGLSTLRELATAPASDIVDVTGLDESVAERVRAFSAGVVAAATVSGRKSHAGIPPGWMRVQVDSDVFKGRLTFEYSALGRYLEPIIARLAEAEEASVLVSKPPTRARAARPKAKRKASGQ